MHDVSRVDTYRFNTVSMMHSGGDVALMQNFIEVIRGTSESKTPLEAGLLSTLMCIKARQSAKENIFVEISYY